MCEQREYFLEQKTYLNNLKDQLRRIRAYGEVCKKQEKRIEREIETITNAINKHINK